MKLAGEITGISAAEVFSVVTFYTMFRQQPAGRFPLGVCRNIACWLNGSEELLAAVERELGITPGQTTGDGAFSLQEVECLGSCGTAPCLEIEGRYFERLDPGKVRRLLERLKSSRDDPTAAVLAAQHDAASAATGGA